MVTSPPPHTHTPTRWRRPGRRGARGRAGVGAGRESCDPGAAAGRRAPTHVETFYIIERWAPTQAPLRGASQASPTHTPPQTSVAPTVGGRTWGGGSWFQGSRSRGPPGQRGKKGSSPLPSPSTCRRRWHRRVAIPASSRRLPARPRLHSPGGPAAGAAPARRARAKAPRASFCPGWRLEHGAGLRAVRGSGPAPPGAPRARCCPRRGLRGRSGSRLSPAGCLHEQLGPHLSRRAPPYNKPAKPLAVAKTSPPPPAPPGLQ